jgi:hypothetical protein
LPLPRLGLPLPTLGLPLLNHRPPAVDVEPQRNRTPPDGRDGRRGRRGAPVVTYLVPGLGWMSGPVVVGAADNRQLGADVAVTQTPAAPHVVERRPAPAAASTGSVRLEVAHNGDVQLYVDGYYYGTLDEVGSEVELPAGPHTMEMRASGAEPLRVDVHVTANRSITYRGTITGSGTAPRPATPGTPAAAATRRPLYVIPGCYAGDVPPADLTLPPNCDTSRTIVLDR